MNVVELWNTCVDWFPATTMVVNSDGGDHLNIYGAKKVSKYLGDYLNDNYSFKKHNKKIIKEWNKDYKDYVKAVKDYENGES